VLGLLLAMAAVLVALGAGFFGLATLSREGLAPTEPTPVPPTARPTAQPTPAAVLSPSATPLPAVPPTATPEPPSPTPVPPSPTPQPPSPTPAPAIPPSPSVPPATPTPQRAAVPQLRGKRLDDARAALQAAGLTTTVRGAPANVDRDIVFDQSPEAGAAIVSGATVSIVVGNGTTAVPDVAERSPEQATKLLQDNSFRVLTQTRRDPRIPAGQAIGTLPAAGTAAPRGAEITLLLSAGR
jgi:outer membrane biosynthesis protein TonB